MKIGKFPTAPTHPILTHLCLLICPNDLIHMYSYVDWLWNRLSYKVDRILFDEWVAKQLKITNVVTVIIQPLENPLECLRTCRQDSRSKSRINSHL